ncbi:NAD-dependent epimerase [Spirochaetia bacterium]|nr:NAD-dependent epimerase [Spirochaetia bacterium]
MKILIIGSTGFIGSNLIKYLSNKSHIVYGADIIPNVYNKKNYIVLDEKNETFVKLFEKNKYDVCINCTGSASVPNSYKDLISDFTLNTFNVLKQLEAIKQLNPECKYINLSSAAVYGNPVRLPIPENTPLYPISPYGYHKKMAEDILAEYHNIYNIKTCSLRIFSAYGEGLKKQILFDLSKKIKEDDKIFVYGTGEETRDFIHVYDICNAIDRIIFNAQFNNDIINIANGKRIKIIDIVMLLCDYWKSKKNIVFSGEIRQGDPANWEADISKLVSLDYKQTIEIKAGIEKYVSWLREDV